MNNLIDSLQLGPEDISSYFTVWELLFSLALSAVLCTLVGYVYRATHSGLSYAQSFVVTTVVVGVIVSVIMLIIGSNIARAFTLVGALSIIRFRNAVKETRDVGFIFLSMAIGMACGTRFFGTAIVFTGFMLTLIYALWYFDAFAKPQEGRLLRVQIPDEFDYETIFADVFEECFESQSLLSIETARQGLFLELLYSVRLRPSIRPEQVVNGLRALTGNAKVSLAHSGAVTP